MISSIVDLQARRIEVFRDVGEKKLLSLSHDCGLDKRARVVEDVSHYSLVAGPETARRPTTDSEIIEDI